jgi:hypothetical protein
MVVRWVSLLAVGVAATAGVSAATATAAATAPLCQASQMTPRFERTLGAAGTFYDYWQLTNVGGSCQTQGWVGGLNFGPDGRPLPTTLHRTNGPSHPLVVAHGQHVSWYFGYTDPGVLNCTPENAVAMILTPPDNFSPVLAGRGERACNGDLKAESPLVLGG